MTIASQVSDIRVLTLDDRAEFLRELAEHVESERHWAHRPFTNALPWLVPAVSSAVCPDPLSAFDALVDALSEFRQFTGDERGYCDSRDLPTHERALENLHDGLQSDVDAALQRLLGGA